ncbi:SMC-Scp complex subunit ScpB [Aeromicrobium sp. A1-2]|nr:SMC-Scp complex subunit ScpB [Aeromicrobium sp. A1-2]
MLDIRPALEAVLMVADQPLDHLTLAQAVGHPPSDVVQTLAELAEEYSEQGRGFELRNIAGGWRFFTREEFAGAVERFILDGQQARLTQAALETMAVVAYRQPISRSRISAIRGVNVDGVVRTLVTRGLIEEDGTDAESGAILYRTTSYFLERMGLGSLSELPDIAGHLPDLADMEDEGLAGAEEVLGQLAGQDPIGEETSHDSEAGADAAPGQQDVDAPEGDAHG